MNRAAVTPFDHAFASGQVFLRPRGFVDALRAARNLSAARRLRRVWKQFDGAARIGDKVRLSLTARIVNKASPKDAEIGDGTALRGIVRLEPKGRLVIGAFCYVGDGAILSAANLIRIGEATLIAHGVQVFDNDTHPVDPLEREAHFKKMLGHRPGRALHIGDAPVIIGSRCWLGMNSIIMKGTSVGDNSIVAPGSVVIKDIPANVLAAGNPAVVIKHFPFE
jgi:acetyltransferase-like isoleucine patch superfamily enzyme